jgi:hypothetical protein
MAGDGAIIDWRTIVDNGNPATRFDIVILAEGFKERQLGLFDQKAKLLASRLLATPPFDEVAHLINVHTVRTASTDSGVSGVPSVSTKKKTYYGVTGHFDMPGVASPPASFLGTHAPEMVLDAADHVAPLETLELFIVICNVKVFAASAFPEQKMAFAGLHNSVADFVNYTLHECGHAIAGTAEEYQDCDGPRPGRVYRNQATEAERLAGTVWWTSLAKANELNAAGGFKAVHLYGDPGVHFTAAEHTPIFDDNPSLNGKLGLYWGCQDIDPSLPGSCDLYEDSRGRNYYRAMAKCRMRNVKHPFCRVCSYLILDRINAYTL